MHFKQEFILFGICLLVVFYMICKCKNEYMDARHFHYLNDKQNNETHKNIYSMNETPTQSTTKCGNFVSSNLLPKNNDVVSGPSFTFAPNKDVKLLIKPTQSVIGVNTQGGSLRNANLDIRSAPPIDKKDVSPWLNSTISPDLYRRPLE